MRIPFNDLGYGSRCGLGQLYLQVPLLDDIVYIAAHGLKTHDSENYHNDKQYRYNTEPCSKPDSDLQIPEFHCVVPPSIFECQRAPSDSYCVPSGCRS